MNKIILDTESNSQCINDKDMKIIYLDKFFDFGIDLNFTNFIIATDMNKRNVHQLMVIIKKAIEKKVDIFISTHLFDFDMLQNTIKRDKLELFIQSRINFGRKEYFFITQRSF
jgi:hypothetical protein